MCLLLGISVIQCGTVIYWTLYCLKLLHQHLSQLINQLHEQVLNLTQLLVLGKRFHIAIKFLRQLFCAQDFVDTR